jgi:hypothetical protein
MSDAREPETPGKSVVRTPQTSRAGGTREAKTPSPPRRRVTSCEESEDSEYLPVPIIKGLHHRTLLYPLLKAKGLLDYFRMEDGVSKRPRQGM